MAHMWDPKILRNFVSYFIIPWWVVTRVSSLISVGVLIYFPSLMVVWFPNLVRSLRLEGLLSDLYEHCIRLQTVLSLIKKLCMVSLLLFSICLLWCLASNKFVLPFQKKKKKSACSYPFKVCPLLCESLIESWDLVFMLRHFLNKTLSRVCITPSYSWFRKSQ